jgi:hypothetical protein
MTGPAGSTRDLELVKVAYANDEMQAEFLQGLLREADVGSVVRRAPRFDVPGSWPPDPGTCSLPRPTSPSRKTCCASSTQVSPGQRRVRPVPTGGRDCSPGC